MIRYQVRSKELIDIVNEVKSERLIMSPYFQRDLVWRVIHKVDFIKTILMGLPFPQIFIAKGSIDLETMTTTSCIVDGQQRTATIVDYINNTLKVDNKFFKEQSPEKQEEILKYQIPIIDLDIQNDSKDIKEIFKRLNRTFYSLNSVERLSTEYASSEFMLFAKHLTGQISFSKEEDQDEELLSLDPTIPEDFIQWANQNQSSHFKKLLIEGNIFTPYEISRKIHLMYALNMIATHIGGFYTRNDLATRYLDDYKDELKNKEEILSAFEKVAKFILSIEFPKESSWLNKANLFSFFIFLLQNPLVMEENTIKKIKEKLAKNPPPEYLQAAKEGVNNRKERVIRNQYLLELFEIK